MASQLRLAAPRRACNHLEYCVYLSAPVRGQPVALHDVWTGVQIAPQLLCHSVKTPPVAPWAARRAEVHEHRRLTVAAKLANGLLVQQVTVTTRGKSLGICIVSARGCREGAPSRFEGWQSASCRTPAAALLLLVQRSMGEVTTVLVPEIFPGSSSESQQAAVQHRKGSSAE